MVPIWIVILLGLVVIALIVLLLTASKKVSDLRIAVTDAENVAIGWKKTAKEALEKAEVFKNRIKTYKEGLDGIKKEAKEKPYLGGGIKRAIALYMEVLND